MLELRHHELRFSFPEITAHLRALTEDHVAATLPRALAEDPARALDRLFEGRWQYHADDRAFRERARHEAAALPDAELAQSFRRLAFAAAGLPAQPDVDGFPTDTGLASFGVGFQRTLRIPDDGRTYPLPAGLGNFALHMVDDHAATVPARWHERGGVMMPMYQAEAMWIHFSGRGYPFAVKIAAGKINAVNGRNWEHGLRQGAEQDYVVVPGQPWLDGFSVGKGLIRQFVAMPLGGGHSVEEQLTGEAGHGGVQLQVHPLRAEVYFRETVEPRLPSGLAEVLADLIRTPQVMNRFRTTAMVLKETARMRCPAPPRASAAPDMGLGAGGKMKQEIYRDTRPLSDWDLGLVSRCFVHLCNSLVWREITGSLPPQPPLTAAEYRRSGIPWFDSYAEDRSALPGSGLLAKVKSVGLFGKLKGEAALPGEGPVQPETVVPVGPARRPGQVREWTGE